MTDWSLHHEPYRHYKGRNPETGKVTWNGANKQRILSVTDVLDGGQNQLLSWAVGNTLVAAEAALVTWFPGASAALATSAVDFAGLAQLSGKMPDSIRDDKASLGTLAHEYLADRLMVRERVIAQVQRNYSDLPYGLRCAIDEFLDEQDPVPVRDERGLHVERAVGDFERAVAGTYDAQVRLNPCMGDDGWEAPPGIHRLDLKSSRTVQPKHFAQVAEYEELAQACGEEPSDYVSLLHITPLGEYALHSIAYGSDDYHLAVETFHRYLGIRRGEARLAKLLRSDA